MQKLERLTNLIALLLHTNEPLTASMIKDRIDGYAESEVAAHRTFERDKEDIREMGIDIEVVGSPTDEKNILAYRINRETYYLKNPGFTPEEQTAIELAASIVRRHSEEVALGLPKVGGTMETDDAAPIIRLNHDPRVSVITDAISSRSPISFRYASKDRELHPYFLKLADGYWYVRGFDRTYNEERTYRVDRIDGEVSRGEKHAYQIPPTQTGTTTNVSVGWALPIHDEVICDLLVDSEFVNLVSNAFGAGYLHETTSDGSGIFRLPVTNWLAFRSMVLEYLDHVEIISPPEFRERMVQWLIAIRDKASNE